MNKFSQIMIYTSQKHVALNDYKQVQNILHLTLRNNLKNHILKSSFLSVTFINIQMNNKIFMKS